MRHTAGFTLIELLIVIAILGIIVAALFPALLGARERAHNGAASTCARELLVQGAIYAIDKDGYTGFDGSAPYTPRSCTQGVDTFRIDVAEANALEGQVTSKAGLVFLFSTATGVRQQ